MNLAYNTAPTGFGSSTSAIFKHVTNPMEFFLSMAWNPAVWPKEKLSKFTRQWAEREFGPAKAEEIADLFARYTKFNGRRKPELLAPDTFSLVNYQEADRVLADWKALAGRAETISQQLPVNERDAFFEQVLYPIKACEIVNELYIAAAKNRLYAAQGRASANDYAAQAHALFHADADLSYYYNHTLAGGKWDHMMDQTHIGYTSWQQPNRNIMPTVKEVEFLTNAEMGVAIEGSASAWPGTADDPMLPPFDVFNQPRHYIDVFNRGAMPFDFSVVAGAPWIQLSSTHGTVKKEQRLWVSVDWSKAPEGSADGSIQISGPGTNSVTVKVNSFNPLQPQRDSFDGFVEADGVVSIEAEHFSKNVAASDVRWEKIPRLRTNAVFNGDFSGHGAQRDAAGKFAAPRI